MLESTIEAKLRDGIRLMGGKCYKFVSPAYNGMPDRLITFSPGISLFVELKAPGKPLKPLQKVRKKELEDQGFLVFKIDSLEEVYLFLDVQIPAILKAKGAIK